MSSGFSELTRLDALEERIAHQDRIIADLNESITSQWDKIDTLERQIARLREEFQNIGAPPDAPDSPPPHY
jgi:SlyX protein